MYVCMYVPTYVCVCLYYLSVCQSVPRSVSVCLYVCLSVPRSVSVCLSISLSVCLSVCLSVVCLSVCLPVCLSIGLRMSVCLAISLLYPGRLRPCPRPLRVRVRVPVTLRQSFMCKFFRSSYLDSHSSESIHIWTIGTLEGQLSFNTPGPRVDAPGLG